MIALRDIGWSPVLRPEPDRGIPLRRSLALLLALCLPACISVGTGSAPSRVTAPVTGDDAITVASFNFPESVLLAEIYAQALQAKGFKVKRTLDLGPRELVEPALERGLVEFVPEYLGTALEFLHRSSRPSTASVNVTRQRLAEAFRGRGVHVLASAEAQDANGLAVTAQTSATYKLTNISDLIPVAGKLVLGGPPECPSRPLCLLGLQARYRLEFKEFMPLDTSGPLTSEGLASGQIDVAVLFTTDGDIAARGFVLLRDDRSLQPAENITPVVRQEVVARYGQRFTDVVDAVSADLTTEGLRQLNRVMSLGSKGPVAIARDWLRSKYLVQG
jgi:osmoprotectant transport system substrate-binding protein